MFFLFSALARGDVFGLDFGAEFIKISHITTKGVEILLNEQSKRTTPSFFAFWNASDPRSTSPPQGAHWNISALRDCSWSFFDSARSHSRRFPANALRGFSPLIGLRNGFEGREVLALMIRHLISTVDGGTRNPDKASIVFTVEPRLPREDRSAIREAISLANVTLLSIVEAPTAAAYVYAFEKRKLFEDSAKVVAFFDIGARHTWAAVFRFTPGNRIQNPLSVDELAVAYNYSLGAELMDWALRDLLIRKFEQTHGTRVVGSRALQHFAEEARRVKEVLTIDQKAAIRLEDVVDDMGLHFTLHRSDFEAVIDEFNVSLHNLFDEVVAKSHVAEVDSIELLGGTSRVPFVQRSLMTVSKMDKLSRTMNADEAIALGAGYIAASMNASFVLKPIGIKPIARVNVTLLLPTGGVFELFNETSRTADFKTLTINSTQLMGECAVVCNELTSPSSGSRTYST
jgi:molecular chaperone DnaK (HSP70)